MENTVENKDAVQAVKEEDKEGIVSFKKPYEFEGKEYTQVDLSSVEDMNGEDLLDVDRIFSASGQFAPLPEVTLGYTLSVAAAAAKLPIDFFNKLPAKEALKVKNTVIAFLNS